MRDIDAEIGQRFGELAAQELPVPPAGAVIRRGRQRRRYHRIVACCLAAAVVAAGATTAAYARGAVAAGQRPSPGTGSRRHAAPLPPPGPGRLLLGEDSSGFVMARLGRTADPVPVPGLREVAVQNSLIATDPAGGWVVSYGDGSPDYATGQQPIRLATVSVFGVFRPFGPVFDAAEVTSVAVRPGGDVVAVALTRVGVSRSPGPATIELLALPGSAPGSLPGSHAAGRTWTLSSAAATMAESLSWAPDGTRLTYIPGSDDSGEGFAGIGAATLTITQAGSIAPAGSGWPRPTNAPGSCLLEAGAWAGDRYLALEYCSGSTGVVLRAVDFKNGAPAGSAAQVSPYLGCGTPVLDPLADGQTLISGCGLEMGSPAGVSVLPGQLSGAASAG